MTKEYLTEHGIAFTEFDVAADASKREEMIELSDQMGVPVTVIGESVVIGFDKDMISSLLGIA